jgi:hypothetical protein
LQKTETHYYIVMAFCSSGDLSQYIKRRGLSASMARNSPASAPNHNERFPNPREGGLNEVIVRCFLGQLGACSCFGGFGRGLTPPHSDRPAIPARSKHHASRYQAAGLL